MFSVAEIMYPGEIKAYKELYDKIDQGNKSQIKQIEYEINRLECEIRRRNNRDLIKELYEEHEISDKNISLDEFRVQIYPIANGC